MNDPLTYLQGYSQGPKRDLIAKYYYQVAEGDPNSGPVAFAVLLGACAEQVGKVPEEFRLATVEFKRTVAEGKELEGRLIERIDRSNAQVVQVFKDELARAGINLKEAVHFAQVTVTKAREIAENMKPVLAATEQVAGDLRVLKNDLKVQEHSVFHVEQATEKIQKIHADTQGLVEHLAKQARTSWLTIGFVLGAVFTGVTAQLPPWVGVVLFGLGIGLLQWLSRQGWQFVRKQAEKLLSSVKS